LPKHCAKCGQTKPNAEFWHDAQKRDGLHPTCIACCSLRERIRPSVRGSKLRTPALGRLLDIPEGWRWCGHCQQLKPNADFGIDTSRDDGRSPYCNKCRRAFGATSYRRVLDRFGNRPPGKLERELGPYFVVVRACKGMARRLGMAWQAVERHYKTQFMRQQSHCAICGTVCNDLVLDHDHAAGKLRGLVCSNCNTGLGMMKDNPAVLRNGAVYLEKYAAL